MIYISKPFLEESDGRTALCANIIDEKQGIKEDIRYIVDNEYAEYLTDEVADAFLVGMIMPAVYNKQDIVVDADVSEELMYKIKNTIIPALSISWGGVNKAITIKANALIKRDFGARGVGCGCSLGVDSLAAIKTHLEEDCPESFKLTHLTYFNAGAMGNKDLKKAKEAYEKDLLLVQKFAKEVGLPVVKVENNFAIFNNCFPNYGYTAIIRNMSIALSLQKLFCKYIVASSYHISDISLSPGGPEHYEDVVAPNVSTESTKIYISNTGMNRTDKTEYIADDALAQKYLYVCWKEIILNDNGHDFVAKIKDEYLNCGFCDKCKRTCLALEIFGKLDQFKDIFNLKYYYRDRSMYIGRVIAGRKNDYFYGDLYSLMNRYDFKIPFKARLYSILFSFNVHRFVPRRIISMINNR